MNMTDPDRRHLHDLEDQLARMTTRAEKAEAELAAHRAEAERPIGVGDVVQFSGTPEDWNPGYIAIAVETRDDLIGLATPQSRAVAWDYAAEFTRIGRAVRMPDGSPVPEIGGGA